MYTDRIDAQQLNDLYKKHVILHEKQLLLKEEIKELYKYTKALSYDPNLINKIIKQRNHKNIDKIKQEEKLLSLYSAALNI
ncbi:MAG: GapR family DNA-binding domain-containing protein [Pseudomonadota bacterium]